MKTKERTAVVQAFRCAIYTRKSTEEGLEQEFNSLDAQRESGEAYIASQRHESWTCLDTRYDDGGFTGGNMDRPALRRLLADIEAGKVDAVVTYKVDRLSRSLLDFAKMMDVFDRHKVSFVSVTQQFNTASSMGRLVLNVLLSFAQFEREIISERTRDKIGAARRKGKWSGGMPLLGYDVVPGKLVVNEDEARRVRAIFQLYAEHQALLPVVHELARRGWTNKRWTTRKGRERGGRPFDRTGLFNLLTNVAYAGKVRHKQAVFPGQHAAIVDEALWQRVQTTLQRNGRSGGGAVRNRFGALLKGLLHCTACGCAMSPTHCKNGTKRYRYYTCTAASKKGWQSCPAKSIPAGAIEEFVVAQIQSVGKDAAVLTEVIAAANQQVQDRLAELATEQRILGRDLAHWHAEVRETAGTGADGPAAARLADLQERIRLAEQRATAIREESMGLHGQVLDERTAAAALAAFTPVWAALTPPEQARLLHLLLERVDYDAAGGQVVLTFQPTGIQTLTDHQHQEQRA